jgi:CubicO group peptidase (beta-lactamase class C family)
MKIKIKKRFTWFILLALITSFSIQSLSLLEFSSKVGDFSFSVPNLSAQDTFWPGNSSEWPEVAPETQGLNSGKISEILEFIENNSTNIQSIIIVRNGYLLFEEYLWNYQIYRNLVGEKEYPGGRKIVPQYSGTKSVISLLIGIALQEGFLDNISQTLYEFFADIWEPSFTNSTLKKNITIEHLLTMNSGYSAHPYYPPDADTKFDADCISFILDEVPLGFTPGEAGEFTYSNEGVDLLSGIITNVTGKSTEEFAKEYLFTPLGFSEDEYYWLNDSKGIDYGGSGFECSPKGQARLGILALNNGNWNGTQIVEPNFFKNSTTTKNFDNEKNIFGYGYLWWIMNGSLNGYYAAGAGGQNIYIIPEYNIIVGFNGAAMGDDGIYEHIISDYILKNIVEPPGNQIPEDPMIPGFNLNMILLTILCTTVIAIVKRRRSSKKY